MTTGRSSSTSVARVWTGIVRPDGCAGSLRRLW
jgi:hypothetical protein